MAGATASLLALRLVRSKLRKRDESAAQDVVLHATAPTAPAAGVAPPPLPPVTIATILGAEASTPAPAPLGVPSAVSVCSLPGTTPAAVAVVNPLTGLPAAGAATANGAAVPAAPAPPPLLWQYPAPYSLYGSEQDAAVHGERAGAGQAGFCRGFRRSLRGRWRRLVRRKPEAERSAAHPYALPAELRDQLKQIYVY